MKPLWRGDRSQESKGKEKGTGLMEAGLEGEKLLGKAKIMSEKSNKKWGHADIRDPRADQDSNQQKVQTG